MIISQRRRYLEYLEEKEKNSRPHYKHIYYDKIADKYNIRKTTNGKTTHYRQFKNLNDAIEYRDKLIANNWVKLELTDDEIYKRNQKNYYKGIRKRREGRKFRVLNTKGDFLGDCDSLEEALYYRDLYFNTPREDVPKPNTLDLKTDNKYFDGLEYNIPERLLTKMNAPKRNWAVGSIAKKSRASYHVLYNKQFICNCRTYEQAYYVKQELNKCDWDLDQLDQILNDYPLWYTWLMEFYRYVSRNQEAYKKGKIKYQIVVPQDKLKDGQKMDIYTNYHNLEDALYERDFLVEHDWDYDLLIECIDDTKNPYYDMDLPPYPERKIRNLRERDYHTEELNLMKDLILKDYNQHEIARELNVSEITIRNWLKRFYNSDFIEFRSIVLSGEDPLEVLEKVPIIYNPDLSIKPADNFKYYIHKYSSKKNPYRIVYNKTHYGTYPNRTIARKVVNKLIACNWNKKRLPEIRKEVGLNNRVSRNNVYPLHGKFFVRKYVDKEKIYFGTYEDYTLACIVRDLLKQSNWNKELLPIIQKEANSIYNSLLLTKNNMFYGNSNTLNEYNINYYEYIKDLNYRIVDGKYQIVTYDEEKGVMNIYGLYETEAQVKEAINLLVDNDWDKSVLKLVDEIGI